MRNEAANYYLRLLGAWCGSFRFSVTDHRALRASNAKRLTIAWMGMMSRLTGASVMSTTLSRAGGDGRTFNHTTRVTKWGVTVLDSHELIRVAEDGQRVHMTGEQSHGPFNKMPYEAPGKIDELASGAEYIIPWLGSTMVQRTRILEDGMKLELTQKTDFSFASVTLIRQAPAQTSWQNREPRA